MYFNHFSFVAEHKSSHRFISIGPILGGLERWAISNLLGHFIYIFIGLIYKTDKQSVIANEQKYLMSKILYKSYDSRQISQLLTAMLQFYETSRTVINLRCSNLPNLDGIVGECCCQVW